MLVMDIRTFHGSLVGLLGRTVDDIVGVFGPSHARIDDERGRPLRLIWIERAHDEDGLSFPIFLTARVRGGKVWAVGIRSPRYFFCVDFDELGDPFLTAVPKKPGDDPWLTNWIILGKGRPSNFAVGY